MGWAAEYNKKGKQIIYSSSFTPSEGEHKLLQFIRTNQRNGITDLSLKHNFKTTFDYTYDIIIPKIIEEYNL
jgi:hypothetical protein